MARFGKLRRTIIWARKHPPHAMGVILVLAALILGSLAFMGLTYQPQAAREHQLAAMTSNPSYPTGAISAGNPQELAKQQEEARAKGAAKMIGVVGDELAGRINDAFVQIKKVNGTVEAVVKRVDSLEAGQKATNSEVDRLKAQQLTPQQIEEIWKKLQDDPKKALTDKVSELFLERIKKEPQFRGNFSKRSVA